MKLSPQFVSSIVGTAILAAPAFAATEATTDPVGFVTATASGGSQASPKLSLVSPTLTRPVLWQGAILTISGTTITVSGTPWGTSQFNGADNAHYVEIVSATNPGAISDITATTGNSITTSDSLTGFAQVGDSIRIRKHVTVADFLGATNSAGLLATDDPSTADEVLVYDGANPATYWYYSGTPGVVPTDAGWKDLAFNPAGSAVIGPNEGVVIKRKTTGNVAITSSGAVKTGNTLIPIRNGLNVLGTVSAKGLTLATSGLVSGNSGLTASDDPTTADEVTIYTATTQANYWYYSGTPGVVPSDAGWYDLAFQPAGSVVIAPGSAFVVNRKGGGAFNWALPAPNTF